MLNEADTKAKLIDPKLRGSGWSEDVILRDRFITSGKIRDGCLGLFLYQMLEDNLSQPKNHQPP